MPTDPEIDFDIDERHIEEVRNEVHNHSAAGINMRSMSINELISASGNCRLNRLAKGLVAEFFSEIKLK